MFDKCINKLLYEARLSLDLDRKEAAKLLHISKLHLKLIEKGYLSVSKKRQQNFIQVYNLRSNFFTTNSNYVADIDKPKDQAKANAKTKEFIAKPVLRWVSLGLCLVNIGLLSWGTYCLTKYDFNPTADWTLDFKEFWTNLKQKGKQSPSILYPGDTKYTLQSNQSILYDDGYCWESISTYGNEKNVLDTNMSATYNVTKDNAEHPVVTNKSYFFFDVFVYNKKRIVYSSFANGNNTFEINSATGLLDENGTLTFRPFQYKQDGIYHDAKEGSGIFKEFTEIFNFYIFRAYENFNILFQQHNLKYTRAQDLINDLGHISRQAILHLRMGTWFTILGTVFAVGFGFLFGLSFYFYYQHKKRGTYLSLGKKDPVIKKINFAGYEKYKKDARVKLVIPEFVMTIIGLTILLLSQLAVYYSITYFFKQDLWLKRTEYSTLANNLLVTAVMLLFYLKLDNYAKKSIRQLLINIIGFFFIGLTFYVAEIVIFNTFTGGNDIFSQILNLLSFVFPGNFIWPLACYALLYLFLFTTPSKYKYDHKKLTTYRCMSSIPTVLLLFSLVWTFAIKNNVSAPYWVQFLFFSKGITLTLFFLVYTYTLYFYQRSIRKSVGYKISEQYFNSKRYFFTKNSIAAITLSVLFIVEMCFKFLYPNNPYKLGNYWTIGILIPLVLFYHPHIGNRNKKWDITTLILNGILTIAGYGAAIIEILTYLNFGEFLFILT